MSRAGGFGCARADVQVTAFYGWTPITEQQQLPPGHEPDGQSGDFGQADQAPVRLSGAVYVKQKGGA